MSSNDPDPSDVWEKVIVAASKIPGARVDRAEYLRTTFSKYYSPETIEKAIATRPSLAGIPNSAITTFAKSSIAWHRTGVSLIDLLVGIPGGWALLGTVPASLAQFFYHVMVIIQKLAYLYGWPDFFDKEKETLDDQTKHLVTVFVGVMFGAEGASRMLHELAEEIGKQIIKRLPQEALTKVAFYQFAKEIAKWLGVKLTKETFARIIARIVPVVSGLIAGTISWISFSFMAKRLRLHLEKLRFAQSN